MGADRRIIAISDPADPRIAAFRDVRERDLVGRAGRFIAEGAVVLRVLAEAHRRGLARAEGLLVLKNKMDGIAEILARFPEDVPLHVAEAPVIDAIAGFHLHRGVLALASRAGPASAEAVLDAAGDPALVLVACGISNHDNAGALFRNAAAFAADGVLLDATCCDPLYRKAIRVSVGAVLTMPYHRGGDATALLEMLAERGYRILALSPAGEEEIGAVTAGSKMALVVGTEGEGLPKRLLQRFSAVRIAQSPGLDSLNVATAAGIALYAIARAQGRVR